LSEFDSLASLGFTTERAAYVAVHHVGLTPARVVRSDRGFVFVLTSTGIVLARPATRLLKAADEGGMPVAGDWVVLGGDESEPLAEAVLPSAREFDIPLALMIGVRRSVNPALRLAGDALGKADLASIEYLCREFPGNRFLATLLSRENQHEFCVYARKFANLMPFGCWWFLNNPSMVEEMTRERIEMLGTSFIPQHSDARILEQVIYKWRNTRRTLAPILANSYRLMAEDGRPPMREEIERDVKRMFRGNFLTFTGIES
jgi:hypothetical protein